jgi:transcriptional regulator with XRE-family HTH domain
VLKALYFNEGIVPVEIGSIILRLRKAARMSQMELAEKIGVSYQQLQKYEYGKCKLTIDRLRQICQALNIPLSAFFQDTEAAVKKATQTNLTEDELILLQYFERIKSPAQKKSFLRLAEDIAKSNEKDES